MQSGKDRGLFISKIAGETIHTGEISGIGLDSLNKICVTSSKDASIK
jgi:hypothetical protein